MKLQITLIALAFLTNVTACTAPSKAKNNQWRATELGSSKERLTNQVAFNPGEILVRFKNPPSPESMKEFCAGARLSVKRQFTLPSLYLLSIEDGKEVPVKIQEVETHALVAYVEPNYLYSLARLPEKQDCLPEEILVRFSPKTEKARIQAIIEKMGLEVLEAFSLPNLFRVKAKDSSVSVQTLVQQLNTFPEILYAEPNFIYTLESTNQKGVLK